MNLVRLVPLLLCSCAWLSSTPGYKTFAFDLAGNIVERDAPKPLPHVANRMTAMGEVYTVPLPIVILFEDEFPEKEIVLEAAKWWNDQLGYQIFSDGRYGEGESMIYIEFSWDNETDPGHSDAYELAVTKAGAWHDGKVNFADIVFYASWLGNSIGVQRSTARHELGHALGVDHSNREDCLMFWQVQRHTDGSPTGLCLEEKTLLKTLVRDGFGGRLPGARLRFPWPTNLLPPLPEMPRSLPDSIP